MSALEEAFNALGSETCDDDLREPGFEKVALYGNTFLYTLRVSTAFRREMDQ